MRGEARVGEQGAGVARQQRGPVMVRAIVE